MPAIDITKTVTIDTSADHVWKILGDGFLEVHHWVRSIDDVTPLDDATRTDSAPVAGRHCSIAGFGTTTERITAFSPEDGRLAYSVTAEKTPGFVRDMANNWTVEADGPERARVTARITAQADGVRGALVAPMLRRKLRGSLDDVIDDLAAHAASTAPSL